MPSPNSVFIVKVFNKQLDVTEGIFLITFFMLTRLQINCNLRITECALPIESDTTLSTNICCTVKKKKSVFELALQEFNFVASWIFVRIWLKHCNYTDEKQSKFPDFFSSSEKAIFHSSHGIVRVGDVVLNMFLQNEPSFDKLTVERPVLATAYDCSIKFRR